MTTLQRDLEVKAKAYIKLNAKILKLKEQKEILLADLREDIKILDITEIGNLKMYERSNVTKLVGLENKELEIAEQKLINQFPNYTKKRFDARVALIAYDTDKKLQKLLTELGLTIVQEKEF
jgi:hypothetical protein